VRNPNNLDLPCGTHDNRYYGRGVFTVRQFRELCSFYGDKCLCCGREDVILLPDHIFPVSRGGMNTIDNIQPLCRDCNSVKRAKAIDFRAGAPVSVVSDWYVMSPEEKTSAIAAMRCKICEYEDAISSWQSEIEGRQADSSRVLRNISAFRERVKNLLLAVDDVQNGRATQKCR
jgi:hypothetical protein